MEDYAHLLSVVAQKEGRPPELSNIFMNETSFRQETGSTSVSV
jgi:hypothetical protein